MPLQVVQVRNNLLGILGFDVPSAAPALALDDITIALNGGMQMLQTAGEDYFTRAKVTLTLSAGTASYTIPSTIQSVIGPVRWNGSKPLRALESQGELDQFARIYLGGTAYGSGPDAPPEAYWVRFQRSGTMGDIVGVEITLAPAPSAPPGTLVFDVVNDAVSYVVADLSSTNEVPIAQNYTETIFLPIVRFLITRSTLFSRQELLKPLTADYQAAVARLGFAGGFPNAVQSLPKREVQA